jgi:peptide/nickel transport system ATP-binding protein
LNSNSLLSVHNLTAYLGEGERAVRAVDGVDFEIRPHETLALLGESGCGKSMTALALMRLLPPAGRIRAGSVRLHEEELLNLPESAMRRVRGRRMAMIFQEPMSALNPVLTVGGQIAETLRGDGRGDQRARVIELLRDVRIPDPERRMHEYPHQLSGGMQQRVMIAMALAGRPELLIADEPTTALDVTIQAQILELLRQLQREHGLAILLITHDLGVVARLADSVAVMYAGRIIEQAPRDEFFAEPKHPYSRRLFESLPSLSARGRALRAIGGFVPSLREAFSGCRFAPRCELADARCRTVAPETSLLGSRSVACYFHASSGTAVSAASGAVAPTTPARDDKPPILEVRGLNVHFAVRSGLLRHVTGWVRAVDGIDFSIARGRTLALVGESGCGKTTAAKGVLQLLRPSAGVVRFEGVELTMGGGAAARALRAGAQIVFQDPYASLNPRMLVRDIVAEGLRVQGVARRGTGERVARLLEQVGLPADSAARYPHEFSGGQRQRIGIARALAVEPRLIVCDEPTSALDVSVQAQILNLLKRLQEESGVSYLFVTHNLGVVGYLAHEVAVMYLGRIVERGSAEDVLRRSRHPYTQALLAAVPEPVPGGTAPPTLAAGDIPSPSNPPTGCHFHPRCPRAMDVCRRQFPGETGDTQGHMVRCHLYP